jgi:hypothetical protein
MGHRRSRGPEAGRRMVLPLCPDAPSRLIDGAVMAADDGYASA